MVAQEESISETVELFYDEFASTNRSFNENQSICENNVYDNSQYIMIIYVGSPIAVLGIFSNILLVILFGGRNNCGTTNLYFIVLAFLDICICLLYILLFAVDVLAVSFEIHWLWHLWVRYVIPFLALSRIIQLTSTYIVVAATVERFFIIVSSRMVMKLFYPPKRRLYTILFISFMTSMIRLPSFWDYELVYQHVCQNVNNFSTITIQDYLMQNVFYKTVYNFYIMHLVQLFIPVIALIALNTAIVYSLKRQLSLAKRFACLFPETVLTQGAIKTGLSKDKVRRATYTLLAIVTSYLLCNTVNLFLSIMEHVAKKPYLEDEHDNPTDLYNFLSDLVSFLFMFNSSIRLFIHLASNESFRIQILTLTFIQKKKKSSNVSMCNGKTSILICQHSNNDVPFLTVRREEEQDIGKETSI